MNETERPKVGVGVMIFRDGKVLLGKRKGEHAGGVYCCPGGHLEQMESFEECGRREVLEETGIQIKNMQFLSLFNLKDYPPRHYVNIGFIADWESGEAQILEPEKVEGWGWYDVDQLPQPLFATIPYYLEAIKTGKHYWDN